ncbi:hypothetical protein pVco14_031 [Vibrio phage pVco-14]|nr:hypothetical protein pVco14_031 [Vibrio phage pVco-14]
MIAIDYPLTEIPYPSQAPMATDGSLNKTLKMASGRRRTATQIPGLLDTVSLRWKFTPEEFAFFMGWWKWMLNNGSSVVRFDNTDEFYLQTGIEYCMFKRNSFKANPTHSGHSVTMTAYVLEDVL